MSTEQTIAGAAKQIADIAGIKLVWDAQDAPLDKIFGDKLIVVDVLCSLAYTVGATPSWDDNYETLTVCGPKKFQLGGESGPWVAPSVKAACPHSDDITTCATCFYAK